MGRGAGAATSEMRASHRAQIAFRGVPARLWFVFDKPGEEETPLAKVAKHWAAFSSLTIP
jgi:hypothetical protein